MLRFDAETFYLSRGHRPAPSHRGHHSARYARCDPRRIRRLRSAKLQQPLPRPRACARGACLLAERPGGGRARQGRRAAGVLRFAKMGLPIPSRIRRLRRGLHPWKRGNPPARSRGRLRGPRARRYCDAPGLFPGEHHHAQTIASPESTAIITDILCDNEARQRTFGTHSPLASANGWPRRPAPVPVFATCGPRALTRTTRSPSGSATWMAGPWRKRSRSNPPHHSGRR